LDTPGHEDFSEDTYRTLTAVDSAVMVIDAARGIEAQTRKLFEVCRLRSVPIITFVNKVDREGRPPFELLDEIAEMLQLDVTPMSWPVGMGSDFEGVYDLHANSLSQPEGPSREFLGKALSFTGLDDPALATTLSPAGLQLLQDESELALGGY
ncbi:GTP-binding protein, partial [Escherichia coli]|uniref:GTP-binding protein n=2 Tax=Pseudomonadota TaxID=1224 RepID=UPI0012FDF6C5